MARSVMKRSNPQLITAILVLFSLLTFHSSCTLQPESKPNLLIIQTDEHNFRTLGCYRKLLSDDQAYIWGANNIVTTPNIDSLASHGIIFTKFYAAAPVCTPSRASFVSGLYPQNTGAPQNNLPLNDNIKTFAAVLSDHGYKTSYIGKWHLDGLGKPQWQPERKFGFEDNRYMFNRGHWKKMHDTPDGPRIVPTDEQGNPTYELEQADEKSFTTDFLTDKGIKFIEKNKTNPFCLYLSLPDPHGPDRVRAPYDDLYTDLNFEAPPTYHKDQEVAPSWAMPAERASLDQAMYFGMVKCIDDNVGKIISYLREQDLLENTIIVFTSDHGDLRGEHHRHNKGNPLEASAKIPFIVHYPEMIPSGTIVKNALNTVDFAPTILNFMGLEIPDAMQGRDFSQLLINPSLQKDWEDIVFMRNAGTAEKGRWIAAITSRYKLVLSTQDEPWLLDGEADPNELINFIKDPKYQEVAQELTRHLKEYGQSHKDPFLAGTKMANDIETLLSDSHE